MTRFHIKLQKSPSCTKRLRRGRSSLGRNDLLCDLTHVVVLFEHLRMLLCEHHSLCIEDPNQLSLAPAYCEPCKLLLPLRLAFLLDLSLAFLYLPKQLLVHLMLLQCVHILSSPRIVDPVPESAVHDRNDVCVGGSVEAVLFRLSLGEQWESGKGAGECPELADNVRRPLLEHGSLRRHDGGEGRDVMAHGLRRQGHDTCVVQEPELISCQAPTLLLIRGAHGHSGELSHRVLELLVWAPEKALAGCLRTHKLGIVHKPQLGLVQITFDHSDAILMERTLSNRKKRAHIFVANLSLVFVKHFSPELLNLFRCF
eukprot:Colp12_sorted_trinity150504_noHs@6404